MIVYVVAYMILYHALATEIYGRKIHHQHGKEIYCLYPKNYTNKERHGNIEHSSKKFFKLHPREAVGLKAVKPVKRPPHYRLGKSFLEYIRFLDRIVVEGMRRTTNAEGRGDATMDSHTGDGRKLSLADIRSQKRVRKTVQRSGSKFRKPLRNVLNLVNRFVRGRIRRNPDNGTKLTVDLESKAVDVRGRKPKEAIHVVRLVEEDGMVVDIPRNAIDDEESAAFIGNPFAKSNPTPLKASVFTQMNSPNYNYPIDRYEILSQNIPYFYKFDKRTTDSERTAIDMRNIKSFQKPNFNSNSSPNPTPHVTQVFNPSRLSQENDKLSTKLKEQLNSLFNWINVKKKYKKSVSNDFSRKQHAAALRRSRKKNLNRNIAVADYTNSNGFAKKYDDIFHVPLVKLCWAYRRKYKDQDQSSSKSDFIRNLSDLCNSLISTSTACSQTSTGTCPETSCTSTTTERRRKTTKCRQTTEFDEFYYDDTTENTTVLMNGGELFCKLIPFLCACNTSRTTDVSTAATSTTYTDATGNLTASTFSPSSSASAANISINPSLASTAITTSSASTNSKAISTESPVSGNYSTPEMDASISTSSTNTQNGSSLATTTFTTSPPTNSEATSAKSPEQSVITQSSTTSASSNSVVYSGISSVPVASLPTPASTPLIHGSSTVTYTSATDSITTYSSSVSLLSTTSSTAKPTSASELSRLLSTGQSSTTPQTCPLSTVGNLNLMKPAAGHVKADCTLCPCCSCNTQSEITACQEHTGISCCAEQLEQPECTTNSDVTVVFKDCPIDLESRLIRTTPTIENRKRKFTIYFFKPTRQSKNFDVVVCTKKKDSCQIPKNEIMISEESWDDQEGIDYIATTEPMATTVNSCNEFMDRRRKFKNGQEKSDRIRLNDVYLLQRLRQIVKQLQPDIKERNSNSFKPNSKNIINHYNKFLNKIELPKNYYSETDKNIVYPNLTATYEPGGTVDLSQSEPTEALSANNNNNSTFTKEEQFEISNTISKLTKENPDQKIYWATMDHGNDSNLIVLYVPDQNNSVLPKEIDLRIEPDDVFY